MRARANEHLDALESAGLIRRSARRHPTHRQKSTLYRFADATGWAASPSTKALHRFHPDKAVSRLKSCPD
jgi:hypothetical protein